MDSIFEELVAVDSNRAFNFFFSSLREIKRTEQFREDDIFYVASVLAHYSQTSRYDEGRHMPVMSNLSEVFDAFILPTGGVNNIDAQVLEIGGAQVLLLAGFFRDQMCRRHNVHWYDQVGQSLYGKASQYTTKRKEQELYDRMAEHFPSWTNICCALSRIFRENRYLIRSD